MAVTCAALAATMLTLNRRQYCQHGLEQARLLTQRLGDLMTRDDRPAMQDLLNRLLQDQDLLRYAFIGTQGQPLAHTFTNSIPPELLALTAGATDADTKYQRTAVGGHTVYDLAARIGPGPSFLHLGLDGEGLDQDGLTTLRWITAIGFLLFLGLSYPFILVTRALARGNTTLTPQRDGHAAGPILELEQANEALRESEGRYRLLYEAITDPLFLHEVEADGRPWRFIESNAAAQQLLGYTREEFLRMSPRDLQAPGEAQDLGPVRTQLRSGDSATFEQVLRTKDGRLIPVEIHALPFHWRGRGAVMALVRDTSESKHNRAALQESKQQLQYLIDNTHDVIYQIDLQGRYLFVNAAVQRSTGYTAAEFLRMNMLQVVPPDYHAMLVERLQRRLAGNIKEESFETEIQRKDGRRVWAEHTTTGVTDAAGRLIAVQGVARDITRRKQTEVALRASQRQLQHLVDNTREVIFQIDLLGNFIFSNATVERMTGYPVGDLLRMNMLDLVAPEDHARLHSRLQQRISGHLGESTFEVEIVRRDGRRLAVEMTTVGVHNAEDRLIAVQGVARDITERKSLEAQLLRTQRLESVGRLAGGIAHDLNNILASIFIATPLLRESLHSPDDLELVDTIESSAQRGADIIKQLLTFSRGLPGQQVPLQLTLLVREMCKIIAETFPKNITAQLVAPPDLPLVSGNTTQLHQVLMNLCVNARDAMPTGGTLTITLAPAQLDDAFVQLHPGAQPGAYVRLSVSDTGVGIPPQDLDQLFDPFFTTKKVGEGTGLGLSTTLGIVRSHHGFILVESAPGQGAEFQIYLPASPLPATPAEATPPAVTPVVPPGQGELVLVVDDETNIRQMTCQILERSGYRVVAAADGAAALALYAQHQPEVHAVLTDLMMPNLDGPALIRELQRQNTTAKIIAMSGYAAQPELLNELNIAAHAFLAKPFGAAVLLQTLRRMLAN